MEEIWKDVVGYEEYFQVSNTGKLFSKRTNKILKQSISKTGYYISTTKIGGRNGINKCFKIHRLVALAFLDNISNKPTVNHIDGNKLNNHVSNLEWATHSEQTKHALCMGLMKPKCGIENGGAKLTNDDVSFIRNKYIPYDSEFGVRALGRKFGVHHSKISKVLNNKSYRKN